MRRTHAANHDVAQLAEEARALVNATADVAGDKVGEARKRLVAALERGKEIYDGALDRTLEGAKAANRTVRENPYQAVGIGFGIGAMLGFLLSRRCARSGE